MRKTLLAVGLILVLVASLFALTACDKGGGNGGTPKYSKAVETYKIEDEDGAGTLTFEFAAKELGFEADEGSYVAFEHTGSGADVKVYFEHDYPTSSDITKEADDFYSEDYHDYAKVEKFGHSGWEIWKTTELVNDYEICLVLGNSNEDGKVYGVDIMVEPSPMDSEHIFDTKTFVESEDFAHMIETMKVDAASAEEIEEANKVDQAYGEFKGRTDGYSDKDGLIFIPSYESPDATAFRAEQRNDNVGIDNYLWNLDKDTSYSDSAIQVRIFPKTGTFDSIDAYKEKKGDMYTWSKATIDGKEYDVYTFANGTKPAKYSDYYSGAFMVGDKVVEFSYSMFAEIKDQAAGPKFFTEIVDSIEYSKEFKGE